MWSRLRARRLFAWGSCVLFTPLLQEIVSEAHLAFPVLVLRGEDATVNVAWMSAASQIVKAYWAAANQRDWDGFSDLLADDVIYEAPQTRERVQGASNYVLFNVEGFPGPWHLNVVQIVGEGRHAASWVDFTNADGTTQPGLCYFDLNGEGKISRITDFWPDPYELPKGREHLVERY
jgi:predicted ester cyclase